MSLGVRHAPEKLMIIVSIDSGASRALRVRPRSRRCAPGAGSLFPLAGEPSPPLRVTIADACQATTPPDKD